MYTVDITIPRWLENPPLFLQINHNFHLCFPQNVYKLYPSQKRNHHWNYPRNKLYWHRGKKLSLTISCVSVFIVIIVESASVLIRGVYAAKTHMYTHTHLKPKVKSKSNFVDIKWWWWWWSERTMCAFVGSDAVRSCESISINTKKCVGIFRMLFFNRRYLPMSTLNWGHTPLVCIQWMLSTHQEYMSEMRVTSTVIIHIVNDCVYIHIHTLSVCCILASVPVPLPMPMLYHSNSLMYAVFSIVYLLYFQFSFRLCAVQMWRQIEINHINKR